MAWVSTPGALNLRAQFDEAFPDRDHASDGTIGDLAHQQESASSHNPDLTGAPEWRDGDAKNEVRALDVDSDLRMPGVTMQNVIDHLRALPGIATVVRYMIYNRKIYRAANGWQAETYTGPSAHTEHAHFTMAFTQAADEDRDFDYRLTELTMNEQSIADKVAAEFRGNLDNLSDSERNRLTSVVDTKLAGRFATLSKLVTDLGAVVVTQGKVIDAMSAKIDKLAVGDMTDIAALAKAVNDDEARRMQQ